MTEPVTATVLTPAGAQRLRAELEELDGPTRKEIVARIDEAREEGDLKENGGYHAAREELGKLNGRVAEIRQILDHATVAEAASDGSVGPGTVVTLKIGAMGSKKYFFGSKEDEAGELEVLSAASPMGANVQGKRAGETFTFTAPSGKDIQVAVEAVEAFAG